MASRLLLILASLVISVSGQLVKTYSISDPEAGFFRTCENSEDRNCLAPLQEDAAALIIRDDSNRAYILNLAEGEDIGRKLNEILQADVPEESGEILSDTSIPIELANYEEFGDDIPLTPQVRLRYEIEGQEGSQQVKSLMLDDGHCECVFLRLGNNLCDPDPRSTPRKIRDFGDLCSLNTNISEEGQGGSPGLDFFAHLFGTYNDWATRKKIGYGTLQAIQKAKIVAEQPVEDQDFYTPKVTSVGVDLLKEGLWIECFFIFQGVNDAAPKLHKNFTNTYKEEEFTCNRTANDGSVDETFKPDDAKILYEAGSRKVIAEIGIRFLSPEGLLLMEDVSLLILETAGSTQELSIAPKTVESETQSARFRSFAELFVCNEFSEDGKCLTDLSQSSPTFTIGDEVQVMMVVPTQINAEMSTSPGILKISFYLVDEKTGKAEEEKGFAGVRVAKTEREGSPALLINLEFLKATSKVVIMEVETALERLDSQVEVTERRFLEDGNVQAASVVESSRISFTIKEGNHNDDTDAVVYVLLGLSVVIVIAGGFLAKHLYLQREKPSNTQRVGDNNNQQAGTEAVASG